MNDCREEEINTSLLEADWNQEMLDFTPSPFSIKEAWVLTQAKWFLGMILPSSWSAGFPNKVPIPCPNNLSPFIGLSGSEQYKLGLGNIVSDL